MFHRRWGRGFFFLVFAFCLASGPLMAQDLSSGFERSQRGDPLAWKSFVISDLYKDRDLSGSVRLRRYWVVAGRVVSLAGAVIPGAVVQVRPLAPGDHRVFKTDASGDFETVYFWKPDYGSNFKAWITVKKRGFQTAHELIDYSDFPKATRLPLTLRPDEPDPALLSQQDLLSVLLPRLKGLGASDGLSVKSQKKYSKAVREFVDKSRPDRALSDFSDVVKRNPACAKCLAILALAELASGNWDGAARRIDSAIELTTKNKTGYSLEVLVLAGLMESWMHRPQDAAVFLFHANRLEPKNKLVLQELGRAYLQLRKYDRAEDCLERSVAAGAGPDARLLWVQALLQDQKIEAANAEMNRYLNGRDVKRLPIEARKVWVEIQTHQQVRTLYVYSHLVGKETKQVASIDYLHGGGLLLNGMEPARNQDDLERILTAVGKNVAAQLHGFQNSTCLETIHQKQLRHNGKATREIVEKFRYLFLMPVDPATPVVTEYRENIHPDGGLPGGLEEGYMLTSGFASVALIFHPVFLSGSQFRYLGRQMRDGHETYVIAFAQVPITAKLVGSFKLGERYVPILEQGLAWVDTHSYHIVRIRTDLLKPLSEVRLKRVTTQIDYQEVRSNRLAQGFWLPKDVTVTVDWRGKTLRNEHQYSDFKFFGVRTSEQIGKPATPKDLTEAQSPPQ